MRKDLQVLLCVIVTVVTLSDITLSQYVFQPRPLGTYTQDLPLWTGGNTNTNIASSFRLGWNWGGIPGPHIDQALHININHLLLRDLMQNNVMMTNNMLCIGTPYLQNGYQANLVSAGYGAPALFNTISMTYWPVLQVDSTQSFHPRLGDTCGMTFGWYAKTIGTAGSGIDTNRWNLDSSWAYPSQNRVLSNLWSSNSMKYLNYATKDTANTYDAYASGLNDMLNMHPTWSAIYDEQNGTKMYVTMNVRYKGVPITTANRDDVILTVRVPWVGHSNGADTAGVIEYDSIPTAGPNLLISEGVAPRNDYRGRYLPLQSNAPGRHDTSFVITRGMFTNQPADETINISAFFTMYGRKDLFIHPHDNMTFPAASWNSPLAVTNYITAYDIQVDYYNNADIAIENVVIGTPRYRKLTMGRYDRSLNDSLRFLINDLHDTAINKASLVMCRVYNVEEMRTAWWNCVRYYNNICNKFTTVETGSMTNSPVHFLHATGLPEYWSGDNLSYGHLNACPYIRLGDERDSCNRCMGLMAGYAGTRPSVGTFKAFADTLNSQYETFVQNSNLGIMKFEDIQQSTYDVNDNSAYIYGLQASIESRIYNAYYKARSLLYNKKMWWANIWPCAESWKRDSTIGQSITLKNHRPATGEEISLALYEAVLLGTKGLFYYQKTTNETFSLNSTAAEEVMQGVIKGPPHVSNVTGVAIDDTKWRTDVQAWPNGEALIYNDSLGGDYLDRNDHIYHRFGLAIDTSQYNWNDLKTDPNHIYCGQKSIRATIYKMHNWITANETELMKLRLVSWYGKGYLKLYSQADNDSLTMGVPQVLSRFVSYDKITTRPIGRVYSDGNPRYENYATIDSGFYDLTLHKSNDCGLDSVFYIGVVNRRTDPLIHDTSCMNGQLVFVPSAELDTLMTKGGSIWQEGVHRDGASWTRLSWKRLGCREVTIPFHVVPDSGKPLRMLHIVELNSPGKSRIDTVIAADANFVFLLGPGDGKMFRITQKLPEKQVCLSGSLNNNGQRKLVAVPEFVRFEGGDTTKPVFDSTMMRYYCAYHEVADSNAGVVRRQIVMRKSNPVSALNYDIPFLAGLDWGPAIVVSDTIRRISGQEIVHPDCAFPSLVVRYDSVDHVNKIYLVYSCLEGGPPSPNTYSNNGLICESITPVTSATRNKSREIDEFTGLALWPGMDILPEWGTPVINASYSGQFIAFSDRARGIVCDFQLYHQAQDTVPTVETKCSVSWANRPLTYYDCLRPSVNSYSYIDRREDECALVWDEGIIHHTSNILIDTYTRDVMYTRVKRNGSYLTAHLDLPLTIFNGISQSRADSTIMKVTDGESVGFAMFSPFLIDEGNTRACVTNSLYTNDRDTLWTSTAQPDVIHWQKPYQGLLSVGVSSVIRRIQRTPSIGLGSIVAQQDLLWAHNISQLEFHDPTSTQGKVSWQTLYGLGFNTSPESVILNATMSYKDSAYQPRIVQIKHALTSLWSLQQAVDMDLNVVSMRARLGTISFNNPYTYNKTRRLYQLTADDYRSNEYTGIVSSASGLMRGIGTESLHLRKYSGFHSVLGQYMVGDIRVGGEKEYELQPLHTIYERLLPIRSRDTFATEWMRIHDNASLKVSAFGDRSASISVMLQRESDMSCSLVAMPLKSDTSLFVCEFNLDLYNGMSDRYRLLVLPESDTLNPVVQYIVDQAPSVLGKGSESENELDIDLNMLGGRESQDYVIVSPNPSSTNIDVHPYIRSVGLKEKVNVVITNNIGQRVYVAEMVNNESVSVDVHNYVPGTYLVSLYPRAQATGRILASKVVQIVR